MYWYFPIWDLRTSWNFNERNFDFEWREWFWLHGFLLSFLEFFFIVIFPCRWSQWEGVQMMLMERDHTIFWKGGFGAWKRNINNGWIRMVFWGRYKEGPEFFRKEGEWHTGWWMNEAGCRENYQSGFGKWKGKRKDSACTWTEWGLGLKKKKKGKFWTCMENAWGRLVFGKLGCAGKDSIFGDEVGWFWEEKRVEEEREKKTLFSWRW